MTPRTLSFLSALTLFIAAAERLQQRGALVQRGIEQGIEQGLEPLPIGARCRARGIRGQGGKSNRGLVLRKVRTIDERDNRKAN